MELQRFIEARQRAASGEDAEGGPAVEFFDEGPDGGEGEDGEARCERHAGDDDHDHDYEHEHEHEHDPNGPSEADDLDALSAGQAQRPAAQPAAFAARPPYAGVRDADRREAAAQDAAKAEADRFAARFAHGPLRFEHFARTVDLDATLELYSREATSDLGRRLVRAALPFGSLEEARMRLGEATEVGRLLHEGLRLPLAGISDAVGLAEDAVRRGRPLEPAGLALVADACATGHALKRTFAGLEPERFPALTALAETIPALHDLESSIRLAVDGERVRDSASAKLQDLRREIEATRRELDRRLEEVLQSDAFRGALQSPKPTIRGGRYVLAVRAGYRPRPRGILHDRSQTEATLYIEPQQLVGLGNELAELFFRERDEITRILWELSREVFHARPALAALTLALGLTDLAVAKARAAAVYDMRAPALVPDGALVLERARHPMLLAQALGGKLPSGEVVPLDLTLGERFDLLVVTGPNTGGKTVVLKTAGLLAALALAGFPIPSGKASQVPFVETFFADIGDEQGIEQSLSTFSAHVAELSRILAVAGPRSLVLIDELGAGTDPEEGSALGAAVLEHLLATGARALVSTHLGALKAFAYSRPRVENASVAFDLETLRPSYRLTLGVPGASHALDIARRLGMPEALVARAEEVRGQRGVGESALMDEVQRLRIEAEGERERARAHRDEAEANAAAAAEDRAHAATERAAVTREADSVLEALYQRLKVVLGEARKRADNASADARALVERIDLGLADVLAPTPFAERRRQFAESLVKGARAFVVSFNREGIVTRINKSKERVTVRLGDAHIETDFYDLSWIEVDGRLRPSPAPAATAADGALPHPDGRRRWL